MTNGEFDQSTPAHDARLVARHWPNSTLVIVRNTVHITALADWQSCASVYVRRFIQTLDAGDTSCARTMPPMNVVARFPVHLAGAPEARLRRERRRLDRGRPEGGVGGRTDGRRRAVALVQPDVRLDRLRAPRRPVHDVGSYYGAGPVRITFVGTRFVSMTCA